MKNLALLFIVIVPGFAWGAAATYTASNNGSYGVCASGTCDAPTAAASLTDGINLSADAPFYTSAKGISITVCADSGQTLTGGGTLTAYTRDPIAALWASNPDLNLAVTSSGVRCQSFSGFSVVLGTGRITWVPTSVTVSGGGVTIYITAW